MVRKNYLPAIERYLFRLAQTTKLMREVSSNVKCNYEVSTMERLSELTDAILEYRQVEKLINTYIDKLPNCLNPNDNRLHGKFNSYGADTGRFTSNDPNLQNIPSIEQSSSLDLF